MGVSTRYFLIEDGTDRLIRIPAARVWRWYTREELAPQFAGRTVRVLAATCVTEGRRVTSIAEVRPRRVRFLAGGRFDVDREMALALALSEPESGPLSRRNRPPDLMPRLRRRKLHERHGFPIADNHLRAVRVALLGRGES